MLLDVPAGIIHIMYRDTSLVRTLAFQAQPDVLGSLQVPKGSRAKKRAKGTTAANASLAGSASLAAMQPARELCFGYNQSQPTRRTLPLPNLLRYVLLCNVDDTALKTLCLTFGVTLRSQCCKGQ